MLSTSDEACRRDFVAAGIMGQGDTSRLKILRKSFIGKLNEEFMISEYFTIKTPSK
jgi:hypothetical protein